ncbi:MAG: AbrB/MazE/SpoVT family DNA-binding domain-containing protein [Thermomicrobiales bacterium]
MQTTMPAPTIPGSEQGGFLTVDEKGRISLPKAARQALAIQPGSALAYTVIDGMLVLISQDKQLALLMERGARALADAGLTARDLIAELPAVGDQIMRKRYGDAFVDELARRHAELHASNEATDEPI